MKYLILPMLFLFVFGCKTESSSTKPSTPTVKAPTKAKGIKTVTIVCEGETMMDMKYGVDKIEALAGEDLKIILINNAKDLSMMHNIVFVKKGSTNKVGMAGMKAGKAKNYIPEMPEVIAASEMAEPGKKVTLVFKAPAKGDYEFVCTYPGHHLSMKGEFIVH